MLSIKQWTLIDADNAAPWILLAKSAFVHRDYTGQAESLARAALAEKLDWYGDSLYAFSQSALPQDLSSLQRATLTAEAIQTQKNWAEPKSWLWVYCSPPNTAPGGNRHDVCDSLAKLILKKGTTFADMKLGMNIGKRVSWPKDRLDALTDERDVLLQVAAEMGSSLPTRTPNTDASYCNDLKRYNDYYSQVASLGELVTTRDALKKSGMTIQEMVHKRRATQEGMRGAKGDTSN
jgi:hypothetical protein